MSRLAGLLQGEKPKDNSLPTGYIKDIMGKKKRDLPAALCALFLPGIPEESLTNEGLSGIARKNPVLLSNIITYLSWFGKIVSGFIDHIRGILDKAQRVVLNETDGRVIEKALLGGEESSYSIIEESGRPTTIRIQTRKDGNDVISIYLEGGEIRFYLYENALNPDPYCVRQGYPISPNLSYEAIYRINEILDAAAKK